MRTRRQMARCTVLAGLVGAMGFAAACDDPLTEPSVDAVDVVEFLVERRLSRTDSAVLDPRVPFPSTYRPVVDDIYRDRFSDLGAPPQLIENYLTQNRGLSLAAPAVARNQGLGVLQGLIVDRARGAGWRIPDVGTFEVRTNLMAVGNPVIDPSAGRAWVHFALYRCLPDVERPDCTDLRWFFVRLAQTAEGDWTEEAIRF